MGGISIEIHRLAPQLAFSDEIVPTFIYQALPSGQEMDCKKDLHCSAKSSLVQRICRRVDTVFSASAIRETTQLGTLTRSEHRPQRDLALTTSNAPL